MKKKDKIETHLCLIPLFTQTASLLFPLLYLVSPEKYRDGGDWEIMFNPYSCTTLHVLPAPAWVTSRGCSSSGWSCSRLDSHTNCRERTAPPWSPWAVGTVPVPEYLSHLLWTLCSWDYFSVFSPTLLTACSVFSLPDFPRAATSLADGCSGLYLVSAASSMRWPWHLFTRVTLQCLHCQQVPYASAFH